jgi:transposase InsO family protein
MCSRKNIICVSQLAAPRQSFHLGPMRITWYLARYYNIKISDASVYRILKSNGLNSLPRGTRLRKVHTIRRQSQVPSRQIQADIKFLTFNDKDDKPIKRYQYTAIDYATRVRALKIFERHNQANAITFIDYVIGKFPFRIKEVRTDNGHEFQAKFHRHVEDKGIRHAYIKPSSPQLNGKVERSH